MPPGSDVRIPPMTRAATPPPWLVGPQWAQHRFRQPGWLLLPLRGFLGVTFVFASLQKLANPTYLDPANHASVVGQMESLRHSSPIGPLLALSLHAPTLVGLLIAFGELAVGLGVLLGLFTRLAAVGGMLLSLTFLLTVSWNTTPYYYGSDIVFFFAWTVIAAFGAADVLSLDGLTRKRARVALGLPPPSATVEVAALRLRDLCSRSEHCGMRAAGACTRHNCPVFPVVERLRPDLASDLDRRTVLLRARAAGLLAVAAAAGGGLTAAIGRWVGGTTHGTSSGSQQLGASGSPHPQASPTASTAPSHKRQPAPGVALGSASQVPAGQAGRFTDPKTGSPAYVVHPSGNTFVAFSAVCTHAGCTVRFDPSSMQFVCPCHGGTYDARTGRVTGGPPPAPLQSIPVHVVNGQIRVD